jgi:hypothetical protein
MPYARFVFLVALLLLVSTTARADIVIELTALTPESAPGGYLPATAVEFQVAASADNVYPWEVRLAELDFTDSSPELTFTGPDENGNVTPEFVWDFSSLEMDALYSLFLDYPQPVVAYTGASPVEGYILEIPSGGSLILGTGTVMLPTTPGVYLLDAVSEESRFDIGFDPNPHPPLSAIGDPLVLNVVPEPGTLVLFGLGALVLLKRRSP